MSIALKAGAALFRKLPGTRARSLSREFRDRARLRKSDTAIVSFPKSGRTFVRAMLSRLYARQFGIDERELLSFETVQEAAKAVPRILFTHDLDAMRRPDEIRIDKRAYAGLRAVLLARHPGDVAVSRYYHLKHRSRDPARRRLAEQALESFVWTEQGGIPSIVAYLNGWSRLASERDGILILRYEDFLADTEATLSCLAKFIRLRSSTEDIADAVEFARFNNLKTREQEGYFSSDRLRPRSSDAASSKVRSGKAGGYRDALASEEVERIDAYVRTRLDPVFGYGNSGAAR